MTTKGMSPMRILAQSYPRKPQSQDSCSNENGHELNFNSALAVSGRVPLCPIPLPSQMADGIGNGDSNLKGKAQVTTPRGKSKLQARPENPGDTPERQTAAGVTRNRFGWHQARFDKDSCVSESSLFSPNGKLGHESPRLNEAKEIRTPSKHFRSSSCSEVSHSSGNSGVHETQLNPKSMQQCLVRAGSSNQSTPRSLKSIQSATNDPGYAVSVQLIGTPTRNVSRTLKYTAGSSASSSSGATGNRAGLPGVRLGAHLSVPARPAQTLATDYQCTDVHYFELEEDPSFWNDHNVQVLIRCRPLNNSEIASQGYSRCLRQETAHTLTYIGQPEARFTFDHVACEKITQEKLFKIAGIPMVDNCMAGYNSCMFAYGQTGSGKTHTMLGDIDELEQRPSDNRGMTPRIFEYLFGQISVEERLRKEEQLKFTCKCSFLEIYNEQITDLLEPTSTNLQMREDLKKGVYVENLSEVEVKSVQDVVFLLLQGAANRRVAATNMNQESSRSHSVFTCIIESQWETESMKNLRFGRLNLVDLAGSERQKSSGAEGERLREAANINKSLSTLGLVIMILVDVAQGKQRHVPYRDSKLTFLLQDSLGGNSKTTIIANVSPSISCASETLSTLKFAQRAKFIRNNAVVNEDASGDVLALRLQIQQLKEELNRLSRQSISRIPLCSGEKGLLDLTSKDFPDGVPAVVAGYYSSSSSGAENDEMSHKKVKALEAVVVGSLRREQTADNRAKHLTEEIEHLNCLVRQREDDAQFNKMMLRFREDKIKRLESIIDGKLCGESWKTEGQEALKEELEQVRNRLDKNPELTRFAMENIRLREQLQRLQDFYGGGERDIMLEEISGLRDQLFEYLETKLAGDQKLLQLTGSDEKEECIKWDSTMADELHGKLEDASRKIKNLEIQLRESKDAGKELADRLQLTEASLIAAQETAAAAQATVKEIRLETEDIAVQQRQSLSEIQEATSAWRLQEWQLRSQLEEAQNTIRDLSTQKGPAALNEPEEHGTQLRMTESIMQLRLELEAMKSLIEEERGCRTEAEEQRLSLSMQLEQSEETCRGLTAQIQEAELRFEKLSRELGEAEVKELETSKQFLQSSEDLKQYKLIIESLENQALLSINEVTNLQSSNAKLAKRLKKKEDELKVLTGCVVFLQSELQRELELKVLELDNNKDNQSSNVKEKLERTRRALEQAEHLNAELQSEQNAFRALEQQKELVREDAELETTEAITVLQSELISLCNDHRMIQERELKADQKVGQLEMDVKALRSQMEALLEENKHLRCLYQSAVDKKDAEITKLTEDWQMAASSLIDCLSEGNQAFSDAAQEVDRSSQECASPSSWVPFGECKGENTANVLEGRLLHAQKLARQTEDKVRMLNEAFLAIADMQRNEKTSMQSELEACQLLLAEKSSQISNLAAQIRKWSSRAERSETLFLAACVVINRVAGASLVVESLRSQNAHLAEALERSQQCVARRGAELEGFSSEYSARVYSMNDCWLNEKVATVLETELLHHQMCLLMGDCTISEARLQALEDTAHDQLACFEEECRMIAQKMAETDVLVQEIENKLQASTLCMQNSQLETIQVKEDKSCLSMHLESLTVELTCDKLSIAMEMDIITHLLIQQFQEGWLQLMVEVMEARKASAALVSEKSKNIATVEALVSEIGMLKAQNKLEKEVSASLNKELSQCHDQLRMLKAENKQAQVKSEHLAFHSRCIEENISLEIFLLVLEEAISKELLLSQEDIVDSEAMLYNSKFNDLQNDIQEYMDKVNSLTLVNANLMEEMDSIIKAAQGCFVQYHIFCAELKRPEKQAFVTGAEQTAEAAMMVFKSPVTDQGVNGDTCFKDNKKRTWAQQSVRQTQSALVDMQQGLKDCCDDVGILCMERDCLLSEKTQEAYLHAVLDTELKNCHSELTGIQLGYAVLNKCVLQSTELSEDAGNFLVEACCIVSQVKEGQRFLLEKLSQKENEALLLQVELQQTRDNLHNVQTRCSFDQEKLQQLLEQEKKLNDEKIAQKDLTECQLQLQLTRMSEQADTLYQVYKDGSQQLHSRNLEIEQSCHQQQELINLISSLYLEKELLREELNTITQQFSDADASLVAISHLNNITKSCGSLVFDGNRLLIENKELKAEIKRQRGDMDCLQHELSKSCNIVFEVRHNHLKTLETLHETEQLLSRLTEDFNAKCFSFCMLEKSHNNLQTQILEISQENEEFMNHQKRLEEDLNLLTAVQGKAVKLVNAIEIQEAKLLGLLSNFDCLLASNLAERRDSYLLNVYEDCQLMLTNLETFIAALGSRDEEKLAISQKAYTNETQMVLEGQALQMKTMSERLMVLEGERNHLQEEKSKREAAMKALRIHSQQQVTLADVSRATFTRSENPLEIVKGDEIKLSGLQTNIQRMTEWISQEIGDDCKLAFTEGCEMVLDAVETEVQSCREQAEIAWRKLDTVLNKRKELEESLLTKNEMVALLQNEVAALQDHIGVAKQESVGKVNSLNTLVRQMENKLDEKQCLLVKLEDRISHLENSSLLEVNEWEEKLIGQKESLVAMQNENLHLRSRLQDLMALKTFREVDLDEKQHAIQVLEMQVQTFKSLLGQEQVFSLECINDDLNKALKERDTAAKERDELHADLVVLSEQLEMAQQIAEEHEAVAMEARQIAEASKTRAEQREEEVRLLQVSVEELESTVSALETQVGIVKSETERQRLMREDTEMEVQSLKHQMSAMQAHQVDNEVLHCKWEEMQSNLEEKQLKLLEAEENIEILEKKCDEKNEQIKKYKNDIMDIISEADRQASDHQLIMRTLETMAEQKSLVQVAINSRPPDRCAVKPRASGSPFKCMGSGLAHQMSLEIEEELNSNKEKIEELEALANSRQKEIFMLNVRLAEAESLTHDVIRDLVGVKLDITNYAKFVSYQHGQNNVADANLQTNQAREKEKELTHVKAQLNEFIEERESWLEEINRRQAEMMTARVAAEKLRQRDQLLSSENETLKTENVGQRNRIAELEEEVNKLSGQQNLQQRIHHHAKIKEENNHLRLKNEDLVIKLRRSEVLLNRVGEELARYREADPDGRKPYIDFEEEQRLKQKLKEVEEEKIQIAQELLTLCTSVLQVAGLTQTKVVDHSVAVEALQYLQERLGAADREISDLKLKNKIESEKRHLSELRSLHSPVPTRRLSVTQPCSSPSL